MTVRALVVGSIAMELSFRIPHHPDRGDIVAATEHSSQRGGAGYRQAIALTRLGADATLIAAVGDDDEADAVAEALEREGVDARLTRVPGAATGVAVPLVTPDGLVARVVHRGANARLGPEAFAGAPRCDVLLVHGGVPTEAALEAARRVRAAGGTVLLDATPAQVVAEELLGRADLIVADEAGARLLGAGGGDAEQLAVALAGEARTAVVRIDPRTAVHAGPGGTGTVSAPRLEVVDQTGVGDAFCAALAVAVAEGAGVPEAVRFACAASSHAAATAGAEAGLPQRARVERLLAV